MEKPITNTCSKENLAEQSAYINRAAEQLTAAGKLSPKAFIHTYGCQQNVSDSEQIKGQLEKIGYIFCDSPDDADFILFNTCAVREHAEDRVWGNIGQLKKLKKAKPDMIIAVCGCMVQQQANADRIKKLSLCRYGFSARFVAGDLRSLSIEDFPAAAGYLSLPSAQTILLRECR